MSTCIEQTEVFCIRLRAKGEDSDQWIVETVRQDGHTDPVGAGDAESTARTVVQAMARHGCGLQCVDRYGSLHQPEPLHRALDTLAFIMWDEIDDDAPTSDDPEVYAKFCEGHPIDELRAILDDFSSHAGRTRDELIPTWTGLGLSDEDCTRMETMEGLS